MPIARGFPFLRLFEDAHRCLSTRGELAIGFYELGLFCSVRSAVYATRRNVNVVRNGLPQKRFRDDLLSVEIRSESSRRDLLD